MNCKICGCSFGVLANGVCGNCDAIATLSGPPHWAMPYLEQRSRDVKYSGTSSLITYLPGFRSPNVAEIVDMIKRKYVEVTA